MLVDREIQKRHESLLDALLAWCFDLRCWTTNRTNFHELVYDEALVDGF